jgi:adenylate cyclase, class 2
MPKEYEAKFLQVDIKNITKKLKAIGAKKIHGPRRFRRVVFQLCNTKTKGFVRVRDENGKITMTSKMFIDPKFPEENEIVLSSSFEEGINFLKSTGLVIKAFHETYREKWSHPLAHEITFDIVPGLPIYMEIDCTSEASLNKIINKLDLDNSLKRYGAYGSTYEEYYGISANTMNNKTISLTFKNILKEIKPKKNKLLLKELAETYSVLNKTSKTNSEFFKKYDEFYKKNFIKK